MAKSVNVQAPAAIVTPVEKDTHSNFGKVSKNVISALDFEKQ
jgi:hypothetical protein